MKRAARVLCLLLSVLLLIGCAPQSATEESTTAPDLSGAELDIQETQPQTAEKTEEALAHIKTLGESPDDNYRTFYEIFVYSFCDSDGDGIGDLNGITEKLSYIHEMGFNAIWLNPFYESPFRDAGYDVTDFYKVAPRYGTNEDFVTLCKEAKKQGIRVVIDLVAGHTSLECEWFQRSAEPEPNEYSNRYIWTNSVWKKEGTRFISGYSDRDGCYMANFFYCQPALNYGYHQPNPEKPWQLPADHPDCMATRKALWDIMEYWLSLGADGFRVDMAPSLIKNDETYAGAKALWQEFRKKFDEKYPECVLISEWSYPEHAIEAGFHIDFLMACSG